MPGAEQDHFVDLIPAYSLGSLGAAEAEAVRQHLAGCESCQVELAAYEKIVGALPLAAAEAEPSAALKDRLLARISEEPVDNAALARQAAQPQPEKGWWQRVSATIASAVSRRRWQPIALLIILALIVGNVLLWQWAIRPDDQKVPFEQITLTGDVAAPEATGIITVSADGHYGTLVVDRLPELDPESQFQLWLVKDGERVDGGVFSVNQEGYGSLMVRAADPVPSLLDYDAFGISIEPAGGSPGPTGPRVLGSNP